MADNQELPKYQVTDVHIQTVKLMLEVVDLNTADNPAKLAFMSLSKLADMKAGDLAYRDPDEIIQTLREFFP